MLLYRENNNNRESMIKINKFTYCMHSCPWSASCVYESYSIELVIEKLCEFRIVKFTYHALTKWH